MVFKFFIFLANEGESSGRENSKICVYFIFISASTLYPIFQYRLQIYEKVKEQQFSMISHVIVSGTFSQISTYILKINVRISKNKRKETELTILHFTKYGLLTYTDEHYLPPAAAMTQELLTSHIYRGFFFCNKKCKFIFTNR